MKCSDAIHCMTGYVDGTLPESTMKALKNHLQHCQDCHTEFIIWKESSKFFLDVVEPVPSVSPDTRSSMADSVMARLAREDKWTFPITAHVFHISPTAKKWMTSVSILFMLVFGVLMFGNFPAEEAQPADKNDWKEMAASDIVMSLDRLRASSTDNSHERDIRYRIMASIGDPLILSHGANSTPTQNTGLITGFLGIMITVVTMSWLSRA